MSPLFIGRHTSAQRMPNRIDEVLLDPRDKPVPDPGEAAKLFAALSEEISPPKPVGLERWHRRRATMLADGAGFHVTRRLWTRCHGVIPGKAPPSFPR